MNEIQINNQSLAVKEYQGQRVVTLKDIDLVHDRPAETAGRNFRKNKKRFIENEDYISIKPSDFKRDEIRRLGISSPAGGYLITETGYLMIVKSLNDDLAWQVQRELVKNYFRVKEQPRAIITTEKGISQPVKLEPKTYNGKLLLTSRDVETVASISKFNLRYWLNESKSADFVNGIDFEILKGSALRRYKAQNKNESPSMNSLTILYKSAIDKLIENNYIDSDEATNTLKAYFGNDAKITSTAANIPFIDQIQAFKIVSEDLGVDNQEKARIYRKIYETNGLNAPYLESLN